MPPLPYQKEHGASSPDTSENSLQVVDLEDGVRQQPQGKEDVESIEFLHLLVEDLRHEVEVLRTQLDESELECALLKGELKSAKDGDRQRINQLVETLSKVSQSKVVMSNDEMETLSAEQASNLTIATLSRKVEELSIQNSTLVDEKIVLGERVQELEGENEAKQIKIGALELQFKAINKTRQKAVQRLMNKDHSNNSSFSSAGSSRGGRVY